jgi:hypothetical protein
MKIILYVHFIYLQEYNFVSVLFNRFNTLCGVSVPIVLTCKKCEL